MPLQTLNHHRWVTYVELLNIAGLDAVQDELKRAIDLKINPYLIQEIHDRMDAVKSDVAKASLKMYQQGSGPGSAVPTVY